MKFKQYDHNFFYYYFHFTPFTTNCIVSSICFHVVEDVDAEKGIPNFWLQAFGNHPIIADIICEHDIPALGFLTNVSVAYNEDYTTFTLSFDFKENPFFTNKVHFLTYMYHIC